MKDVFRSGYSSKKFNIAEVHWYLYAPSYVSPAYHLLEGFPFIQEPPSGDLQERVLIRHHDYDQCFQSVQLLQWNSQVKFFFSSRRRHTRWNCDWSSDVCSSDLSRCRSAAVRTGCQSSTAASSSARRCRPRDRSS